MSRSPPLRFVAVVLGAWAALRTALIAPPWPAPTADAPAVAAARAGPRPVPGRPRVVGPVKAGRSLSPDPRSVAAATGPVLRDAPRRPHPTVVPPSPAPTLSPTRTAALPPFAAPPGAFATLPDRASSPAKRWSLSAWAFVRRGDSTALAAGGLLGGSQAGARLTYRLGRGTARPLALSLRLSAPLQRAAAAEAALGLDWQPDRRLPVHVLAERRQALGRDGRSAFAATVYGGISDARIGRFRLDAYAQAGLAGVRSRDAFGDGSLRLSLPLGERVRIGGGAWAAAQPGVSRLDLGPQAALRLPVAGRALVLAADWRLRAAGAARPGSGPTLTLATDF